MKINLSFFFAAGAVILLIVWLGSGQMERNKAPGGFLTRVESPRQMKVQVREQQAAPVVREVVIQGQTEAWRTVTVRAETAGRVARIGAARGRRIRKGELIVALELNDRQARLERAQAQLRQREADFTAIKTLGSTGFQAKTQIKQAEAALAAARADQEQIRLEIANTEIRAPFSGVLHDRVVEVGDYVDIKAEVATLVDERALLVSGQISQQHVNRISVGQPGVARLITGEEAEGTITYLAAAADPATRSFRVELAIPNPVGRLAVGVSAELRIPVETIAGHFLSPALLSLDERGELGIKTVEANGQVGFHPVEIVRTSADGIWVSGLPDRVQLITLGQGFVQPGEVVTPVLEEAGSLAAVSGAVAVAPPIH
jgi:membrane fusion protein, multidrug efflux system